MRHFLTYILFLLAIPLQLQAVVYSNARYALPIEKVESVKEVEVVFTPSVPLPCPGIAKGDAGCLCGKDPNHSSLILHPSSLFYSWDAAGRLMQITNNGVKPAIQTEFTYFADNRRATKKVSKFIGGAWQHQKTLQFIWDGWKLSAEIEKNPANTITAVRHFVYGPDVEGQKTASLESSAEGIGGLILIREWKSGIGEHIYLPLSDALGNICGLIDGDTGALVAEYEYSPYGQLIMESGSTIASCPFRHRTRYYDKENWLYYYGHRYYDPVTTKWSSKDPLGETGGWNLTAFCDDDPINKYDPNGLATQFYTWKDPNTGAIRYGAADTYDVFYLGFEKAVLNQEIAPWNTTYGVPFGDKALSLFEGESLKMLYGPGVAQDWIVALNATNPIMLDTLLTLL